MYIFIDKNVIKTLKTESENIIKTPNTRSTSCYTVFSINLFSPAAPTGYQSQSNETLGRSLRVR